ncbi:uncharacterized protein LOC134723243 [Mytilus trossulus]|uniref:uncharacterized protein LOC134723243 n=1 Tax=Mytilus trossulus TaxID=6551 RepID=UPI0030056E7E
MANKLENIIYCGPCESQHLTNIAELWCPNCTEGLCSTCLKYHNVSKSTRMHKTITIENLTTLPDFVRDIDYACSNHSNVLDLYCSVHEKVCCMDCITSDHSECPGITSLVKVVQGVKESAFYHSIMKNIEDLTEYASKLQKNRNENADKLQQEKRFLFEKVKSKRKEIASHLDKLEEDLLQQIDSTMTQESQQINEAVSNLQKKIDTLTEYKSQISSLIENATEVQTFLGLKEIDNNIVKEEENMSRMVVEPGMKETSVKMEFANEIDGFADEIKLMGNLELNKVTTDMRYAGTKSQLAKSLSNIKSGIDNIKLSCITKFKIPYNFQAENNICSCAILADERVILLNKCSNETSGGLHIFKKNGDYQERVLCTSNPSGLAVMNKSEIAVSFCKEKSIKVYESEKFTVQRLLIDGHLFCGLSCESECLISGVRNEGIYFISCSSGTILKILPTDITHLNYVHIKEGKTLISDFQNNILHCRSSDGELKWKFSDNVMKGPRNICTDNFGNIFVASRDSASIIVISSDGHDFKKVLGVKDGVQCPKAVCYDVMQSILVIASGNGLAKKYKLSYI